MPVCGSAYEGGIGSLLQCQILGVKVLGRKGVIVQASINNTITAQQP